MCGAALLAAARLRGARLVPRLDVCRPAEACFIVNCRGDPLLLPLTVLLFLYLHMVSHNKTTMIKFMHCCLLSKSDNSCTTSDVCLLQHWGKWVVYSFPTFAYNVQFKCKGKDYFSSLTRYQDSLKKTNFTFKVMITRTALENISKMSCCHTKKKSIIIS